MFHRSGNLERDSSSTVTVPGGAYMSVHVSKNTNTQGLCAAESFVLAFGSGTDSSHILRLLLVELRTRGIIQRTSAHRGKSQADSIDRWTVGPEVDSPINDTLAHLRDQFLNVHRHSIDGAVDLASFMEAILGSGDSIIEKLILPALQKHHLYEYYTFRKFWLFGSHGWRLTTEGETQSFQLQRLLMDGQREFSFWSNHFPHRAVMFLNESGPAALTLTSLYPFMERFGTQIHRDNLRPSNGLSGEKSLCFTTWAGLWRDDQAIFESLARAQHREVMPQTSPSII